MTNKITNNDTMNVKIDDSKSIDKKMKINIFILLIAVISVIGTVIIYPSLPDQIPVHWNWKGEVDNYGGKSSAFFTALLPLLMAGLLYIIPKIDPRRDSFQKHQRAYVILVNFLMIFFVFLHWGTMLTAIGYDINIGVFVRAAVGILLLIIGNYMGQIRYNYTFGIRTPWTLANEIVWQKTHQAGKWVFVISGLLFIISAIISHTIMFAITFAYFIGAMIYLVLYSYLEFRKISQNNEVNK